MKNIFLAAIFVFSIGFGGVSAQDGRGSGTPSPTPKLSVVLAENLRNYKGDVPREDREKAYAKLLEGQRFIWLAKNQTSQTAMRARIVSAKAALEEAAKLNPFLTETYTALAEINMRFPPQDLDEAQALAEIAARQNKDNFGAHHVLAIIYTVNSGLREGSLNEEYAAKAVSQWREIARLDSQNAEAWAFLSHFYERMGKSDERIDALNRWLSSAEPLDPRFYRSVMGRDESLSPTAATPKLGEALLEKGETARAVSILSRAITEDASNAETIALLGRAIEEANETAALAALEALQQAVFANPENLELVTLLAKVQIRTGKTDDGIKILRDAILKLAEKDKNAAANLQIALGDIYAESGNYDQAVAVYQNALVLRGIENNELITDDDRDFAYAVYGKIAKAYKTADRFRDARTVLENARPLFGKSDTFIDLQLYEILRESGEREEALKVLRAARLKFPADYGLLRYEAALLTELGRIEEAVGLISPLIGKKTETPSLMTDDFNNHIFIARLYIEAKRGAQAVEAANAAHAAAQSEERRQIARLTLATAQQTAGEFAAAEKTLRDILKQTPGNPIALNNLGYFLLERDERYEEALRLIEQAVEIDETNPSYLDSLGWAYFKLGRYAEAEKYLKKAAKLDPTSATILEHLGDVYAKQKKNDLAREYWRKALRLSTDTEEVSRLEGKIK